MAKYVTPEIIKEYRENGAILIKNAFDNYWINKVKAGIEYNLQNPSAFSEKLVESGDSGAYFNDYCNWQNIPEFKEFIYNSPAAEIAGLLMESKFSVFYHEHVLIKEPGTTKETPWHHDQAYYPIDGFKVCSIWMPVDYVPMNSAVMFASGSHLGDKWYHPRKFATSLNYENVFDERSGRIYYNVPTKEEIFEKFKILRFQVNPGDCIVFHMRTLHGAPGNASDTLSRRVLSTRWIGDDGVIASRPWETSPPTKGGLKVNDNVMSSDEFPMIWKLND